MQDIVSLTERGTLTLPSHIRKALGLTGGQQFIVATTPQGELILRPAATIPLEIYSEERITEFAQEDTALGKRLDKSKGSPG
jgi:AbrB family looped-hinge helix DNA binding protein